LPVCELTSALLKRSDELSKDCDLTIMAEKPKTINIKESFLIMSQN